MLNRVLTVLPRAQKMSLITAVSRRTNKTLLRTTVAAKPVREEKSQFYQLTLLCFKKQPLGLVRIVILISEKENT